MPFHVFFELFNVLVRFSYTVLFELMKTIKLLLFPAICPDLSETSRGRNWNFSMKPVYLLLLSYMIRFVDSSHW